MSRYDERMLIEWAHGYNGYERIANGPDLLRTTIRPVTDEYERTRTIPDWAGVDLLRAWAFYLVRVHRHSGGYEPLTEEYPEFLAIVDAIDRHPAATSRDRPPAHQWPYDEQLHAWWVLPGRLLAGEYPGAMSSDMALTKLGLLMGAGITKIVDLTTQHDRLKSYRGKLDALASATGLRVSHESHPVPDLGVIDSAGYDAILRSIHAELASGGKVYVHCWSGRDRTSTVVGCLLADSGLTYEATIDRIAELRAGTRKAKYPCPESSAQHEVLRARCKRPPH